MPATNTDRLSLHRSTTAVVKVRLRITNNRS